MPIEAVKIPQNVNVEEKIIGPISLRQILICMVGGGISYAIWSSLKAAGSLSLVSMILAWIPAMISAAFAFIRVSDIGLFRFLLLAIERTQKPTIRTWQPRRGIEIVITVSGPKRPVEETAAEKRSRMERIEELSSLLDEKSAAAFIRTPKAASTEQATQETESAALKPVNPAKVSVSPMRGDAVDSIVFGDHPQNILEEADEDLVRDISPAP